jgi:hypothetical protein
MRAFDESLCIRECFVSAVENTSRHYVTDTRNGTITAGMAAGAAALALLGAPVAHAGPGDLTDPNCQNYSRTRDGYVADMHRCGFASLKSGDALLATGQRICGLMRSENAHGREPGNVTAAVVDATGWSHDTAVNFTAITMADLCPELETPMTAPTPSVPYPSTSNFPPNYPPPGCTGGNW